MIQNKHSSKQRRKTLREKMHDVFYRVGAPGLFLVNDTLAIVTLISVLALALETVPELAPYEGVFFVLEWVAVIVFSLEYGARIFVHKKQPWRYVTSFYGIVDLLSILPSLFLFGNFTFLKTVRALRILRLFRMIRLAKIANLSLSRRKKEGDMFGLSVQIYLLALVCGVTFFGATMYVAEGYREEFSSIPLSALWAMKVTMGGVSQHSPDTAWGEVILVATRFFGLLLFGLMISIMGSGMKRLLLGSPKR